MSDIASENLKPAHSQKPAPLNVYAFVPSAIYKRKKTAPPPLAEDEILQWADAFYAREGKWPNRNSGPIPECPPDTWGRVNGALIAGGRGLLGDSSLTLLLWQERGARHPLHLPAFTYELILEWADAYYAREGKWPGVDSGLIPESPGDSWQIVRGAMERGNRGLPGGMTLARLLVEERGARKPSHLPPLLEEQILEWADAFHFETGAWPDTMDSHLAIADSGGETWGTVHSALQAGNRRLPGGSSLPRLLEEHRGVVNIANLPRILEADILCWADAYFERHGTWPVNDNKVHPERCLIPESPGTTWNIVNNALSNGTRGLPGGSSLALLLEEQRGKQHRLHLTLYTEDLILAWADAHKARHGDWPGKESGSIPECKDATWGSVDAALSNGSRGLPGGSSLARLLYERRGRQHHLTSAPFTEEVILEWADAFHARHGHWPVSYMTQDPELDFVLESPGDTWCIVRGALSKGLRGLPGGTTLALLLAQKRGAANVHTLPDFTEEQILEWADAHFARTGTWPRCDATQPIPEAPQENWRKVFNAMRLGLRGMPGGVSLASFLEEKRGKRNVQSLRPFTIKQILAWADAFHARTGKWPNRHSGPIAEQPDDTWMFVSTALSQGCRGFSGGSSLALLLHDQRGAFHPDFQPQLTVDMILGWADAHFTRTGDWPHCNTEDAIADAPDEKWSAVNTSLQSGNRGLSGGSSLALLLQKERGRRSMAHLPPLTEEQILAWADAHFARTGKWPECLSNQKNPVAEAPDESWDAISSALQNGHRGLPGGPTLAQMLQQKRGKRNLKALPPLTEEQILAWADAHFARTGKWPATTTPDVIADAPGETWSKINNSLSNGDRSLRGGSSLAVLLEQTRGKRMRSRTTPLTEEQIAGWARAHRERTGRWPTTLSGEVVGGDGTLWAAVNKGLQYGNRGLPGGSSLRRLCEGLEKMQEMNPHGAHRKDGEQHEPDLAQAA